MISYLTGKVLDQRNNYAVVAVAGIGFKVFVNQSTIGRLPVIGGTVSLFCHTHVPEGSLDLYGFLTQDELDLFELLISVSGVGPKSALSILDISELIHIRSAITEGRPDLLSRASGVGRKTAERIIVELKSKIRAPESESVVRKMDSDADLVEALVGLGYRRDQARSAITKVPDTETSLEKRLKSALGILHTR